MNRIIYILVLCTGVFIVSLAYCQQRIAAAPAYLQLTGESIDGDEVSANTKQLSIMYEPGVARGELQISQLKSMNQDINELITQVKEKLIYFTISIPEGKFAFGDSMNERFSTQGEIVVDDHKSAFTVEFDVSNMKDNRSNAFKVIGQGKLSFHKDFNVVDISVKDSFAFYFNQNLTLFKP